MSTVKLQKLSREQIDLLIPEHDCASCNDSSLTNAAIVVARDGRVSLPRCTRCYLLNNDGEFDPRIQLHVEVELSDEYRTALAATDAALLAFNRKYKFSV